MSVYDKFTDRARKVMQLATKIAKDNHAQFVGTECLLYGLARLGEGVAYKCLARTGVYHPQIEAAANWFLTSHGEYFGDPVKTFEAAVDFADKERESLGHNYLGTEHLLLGILAYKESDAVEILRGLDVNTEQLRQRVLFYLGAAENPDPEGIPRGMAANPDYDTMEPFLLSEPFSFLQDSIEEAKDAIQAGYVTAIATHLYAQEVSKPEPVNMPKPDYEQIAKDCVARAKETAPYLLQELGSVPTSVRQEEE